MSTYLFRRLLLLAMYCVSLCIAECIARHYVFGRVFRRDLMYGLWVAS